MQPNTGCGGTIIASWSVEKASIYIYIFTDMTINLHMVSKGQQKKWLGARPIHADSGWCFQDLPVLNDINNLPKPQKSKVWLYGPKSILGKPLQRTRKAQELTNNHLGNRLAHLKGWLAQKSTWCICNSEGWGSFGPEKISKGNVLYSSSRCF